MRNSDLGGRLYHVFRTDDLPAAERFESWWETIAASLVPLDVTRDREQNLRGEIRSLTLGDVELSRARCTPFEARRTRQLIRKSDPGVLHLSLSLRGGSVLEQSGREVVLRPGDMVVYGTSTPFRVRVPAYPGGTGSPGEATTDGIILQISPDRLPLPRTVVERVLLRPLSGRDGMGAVLATVLRQYMAQATGLVPGDAGRLATLVTDLLGAVVAREAETDAVPPERFRSAQFLQVTCFIERNLGSQDLGPAHIAAAHHMSTRALHQLFQRNGTTVAGWIRQRRLERCRRELSDPRYDHVPVATIAARNGFASATHFNRLFRAVYGAPPSAYRRELQVQRYRTGHENRA